MAFYSKDEPVHTPITFPVSSPGHRVVSGMTTSDGMTNGQDIRPQGPGPQLGLGGWGRVQATVMRGTA